MNTEAVLAQILPAVEAILKAVVEDGDAGSEPATLYALEERVQAVLPRIGQVVLQGLVDGQGSGGQGPERACGCGGVQRSRDQARRLSVQTSLGPLVVDHRAYYQCARCRARGHPLDERLGLKGAGRMSRYLQEQVAWLYALLPAGRAAQALERFGWPALCVSQIREQAQALGAELEQREQAHVQVARQEAERVSAQQRPPRQPMTGARGYAAPDGVMYCTTARDPDTGGLQWRELKVAAVYAVVPEVPSPLEVPQAPAQPAQPDVKPRARERIARGLQQQRPADAIPPADRAAQVTYVVETGPWLAFGGRLWAELWERGVGRSVTALVVVADGSDHIDQVVDAELRLPGLRLTRILDLAHAQQHVWAASRAAFGEGSPAGRRGAQAPLRALERGEVDRLLAALQELADQAEAEHPEVAAAVRHAAAYFAARRVPLDYPAFVAAGDQIGSGLAESGCKRFGTERLKRAGRRWTVPGAQATATLRALLLSDRWQAVSAYCRRAA